MLPEPRDPQQKQDPQGDPAGLTGREKTLLETLHPEALDQWVGETLGSSLPSFFNFRDIDYLEAHRVYPQN